MIRTRSSQEEHSTFEPPKKQRKSHHHDKMPQISKDTLLKAMSDVEDEVKALDQDRLSERLKDLREQVKVVLETREDEIKRLHEEIYNLKREVELLKGKYDKLSSENEELKNTLDIAQVTWEWEAHVARFVVDSSTEINQFGRFKQMNRHLDNVKSKDNLWIKIKNTIGGWTQLHWEMVNDVRAERNGIAHPDFIDLDLIKTELQKIFQDYRQPAVDMLNILKATAGLMKFGRLTKFYISNKKHFPVLRLNRAEEDVLKVIISWDREFEQIDGLQHVEHEDAKKYLAKFVNDPKMITHYFRVLDFIKYENGKVLGKIAWGLQESGDFTRRMTAEERMVVNELKRLVPKNSRYVVNFQRSKFATIAKLHIPDFLPKHLWKYGVGIVEKYFIKK